MTTPRTRRTAPLLLLPVLLVAACGTERAGAGAAPPRAELEARARAAQTSVDFVYVTEVTGFTVAKQSVGVVGDDGYGAVHTDGSGRMFQLSVERKRGQKGGYRKGATDHRFVRIDGERVITASGELSAVDEQTLRDAVDGAHRANDRELDEVLPEATASGATGGGADVERGDLPADGDGAPVDPVDPESASG
ncbi:hypothetical protein [Streptomyces sp. NPDC050504]|uniref:hypothetical protein n=1 Tax=Streptomyces sp. NPDC050504 TaxID=3365618 RepID=UPI003799A3D8